MGSCATALKGVTCTFGERDCRVDPGKHTSTGHSKGEDAMIGLPYLALLLQSRQVRLQATGAAVRSLSAEQGTTRSDSYNAGRDVAAIAQSLSRTQRDRKAVR